MNNRIIVLIAFIFAVGCMPTAKRQWVSTIKVKPSELPVSKEFLDRVQANWYYNKTTKCYGVNIGFNYYLSNYAEKGFKELQKMNKGQFLSIFGEPDIQTDSTLIYLHIDYKTRKKISYPYGFGTPTYYLQISWNQKIFFGETNDINGAYYYAKKFNYPNVISTMDIDYFSKEASDKAMELINQKAKKSMSNYFFYNRKAGHYVHIYGCPLPQFCESKVEVLHLFGKPSKVEDNGDLVYYLSLPNHYGDRNFIRWSVLPDGKYAMEVKIQ
jgi:hypothetical protein